MDRLVSAASALIASIVAVSISGCAAPANPSFDLTVDEARAAIREMRADPVPAPRPVVVVAGYADPGLASRSLRARLQPALADTPMLGVSFVGCASFDSARSRLIERVETEFPDDDPDATAEVDVVAISMGGLVARHAALRRDDGPRLRVVRLFTIGAPFRGANIASGPALTPLARAMRAGSKFLKALNADLQRFEHELVPYVRSDDWFVGAPNASPPGVLPWWVPARFLESGHLTAHGDPRIVADILRRLRGETPFTTEPRAPLPE